MARLTYKTPDGSWGILGLDWKELSGLPPLVYGAMHKLMEMEELIAVSYTHLTLPTNSLV